MEIIAIIGLLIAVFVMIFGAYKGLGALPLTLLAGLIVIISNGISLWTGINGYYIGGFTGTLSLYLVLFLASCLYAKFMDVSGSAKTIAVSLIDKLGTKNILFALTFIIIILVYGGVSLFVALFAVGPIAISMLKEANLPRHLALASFSVGAGGITVTMLPGTTQLSNVIPSQYLGTTLTAAPVFSIILALITLVASLWYIKYVEKKAVAKGEVWSDEGLTMPITQLDRSDLPPVWKAYTPIILLIIAIVILTQFVKDTTMLTTYCMVGATVVCYLLNLDKFKGKDMKKVINVGLTDGVTAIVGLAAVVGFGTVVQYSAAFANVTEWVLKMELSPYWKGIVATAVISGVTGSSTAGLNLLFQNFGEYFMNSGCNLEILHRLCAVASGTLDSLPHNSALFLTFAYMGLTHKEGYKHYWWMTVVLPTVLVIGATAIVTLLGL